MKGIIRFCYRLVIDAAATEQWQKEMWNDSYAELRMQSQLYNAPKQYRLYRELVKAVPAAGGCIGSIQYLIACWLLRRTRIRP